VNKAYKTLFAGMLSMVFFGPALAHESSTGDHTHAFRQTGSGTLRQGHAVNGPNGDIVIWSARPSSGYETPPPVRFARPEPILKAPSLPRIGPASIPRPAREFGKPKRD